MSDPIFDLDTWEPMYKVSKDLRVDTKGSFSMRVGENMAMDLDTGKMHFTTPWELDNDSGDED